MKKKIVIALLCVAAVLTIVIYGITHPTHYLYNDSWIIGKTASEITERYGEFDRFAISSKYTQGYCVKPQRGEDVWPEYYVIRFDAKGIAYKVEIVEGGWGG